MDFDLLQHIKNNLLRRLKNFDNINMNSDEGQQQLFLFYLASFWQYIKNNDITSTTLEEIEAYGKELKVGDTALEDYAKNIITAPTTYWGKDEKEQVCFSYFLLKHFIETIQTYKAQLIPIGMGCEGKDPKKGWGDEIKARDYLFSFKRAFIQPLYNYILERLDENQLTISILLRYKQKCEWFQRNDVRELQTKSTSTGEDELKQHLFEYLHDQGWHFIAEPESPKGKVDIILNPRPEIFIAGEPTTAIKPKNLITEAKIFDGSNYGKSYLKKGFNQNHTYTSHHNTNTGYLLVYKTCTRELRLNLDCHNSLIPFVKVGNKIIYILVIDIADYKATVSKRKYQKAITMSVQEFLSAKEDLEETEEDLGETEETQST